MRRFVDFLNVTVAVLAGAYLVLLTLFATDSLRLMPDGILAGWGGRALFLLVGAAIVGANVRVLTEEWRTGGLRSNLRITTEQGTTEFSVPSLEMLILRDLKAEQDVAEPTVFLQPRGEGKPMLCKVELKLRRREDVLKRIDSIKKKVRDAIDRLIPGGLTVEVLVEVRDFVSDSMRNTRISGRTAGREVLPAAGEFNGPVYSDGGGSEGV